MQSEERLKSLERVTDLPLLILALALIPLLILPEIMSLSATATDAVLVADWLIWAVFALDFGLKLAVTPARPVWLRTHWLEAAMVVLPFLRPLRAARALRVARLATVLGVNVNLLTELGSQKGTKFVAAAVLAILVVGATLTWAAERQDKDANIDSLDDSLWWASTTMTTVGYGDRYPVTPMGRGVAVALMPFGIAALSAVTATIAAYLVKERQQVALEDVMAELLQIRAELSASRQVPLDSTASLAAPPEAL